MPVSVRTGRTAGKARTGRTGLVAATAVVESVTTTDGSHSLTLNFNSDWAGDSDAIVEAEFCGT